MKPSRSNAPPASHHERGESRRPYRRAILAAGRRDHYPRQGINAAQRQRAEARIGVAAGELPEGRGLARIERYLCHAEGDRGKGRLLADRGARAIPPIGHERLRAVPRGLHLRPIEKRGREFARRDRAVKRAAAGFGRGIAIGDLRVEGCGNAGAVLLGAAGASAKPERKISI